MAAIPGPRGISPSWGFQPGGAELMSMLRSSPVPKIDVRQGCDGFKKITLKCGAVH